MGEAGVGPGKAERPDAEHDSLAFAFPSVVPGAAGGEGWRVGEALKPRRLPKCGASAPGARRRVVGHVAIGREKNQEPRNPGRLEIYPIFPMPPPIAFRLPIAPSHRILASHRNEKLRKTAQNI